MVAKSRTSADALATLRTLEERPHAPIEDAREAGERDAFLARHRLRRAEHDCVQRRGLGPGYVARLARERTSWNRMVRAVNLVLGMTEG